MDISEYHNLLELEMQKIYSFAKKVREKGYDPSTDIEIKVAHELSSRVEALVGPKGIKEEIKRLEEQTSDPVALCFKVIDRIIELYSNSLPKDKLLEQSVRTAVAILTEGVLVAPTEGISKILIHPDNYAEIYFAGPIRSAGGTAAAMSVVFTDYARKKLGIGVYKPTEKEVDRYVEEIDLYEHRESHLQYKPPEDKLRFLVKHCPVCVNGEPTGKSEVSVNRDLPRVATNRVRGGVALVLCEGIALKSAKLLKYNKKFNLGWDWINEIVLLKSKKGSKEIVKNYTYLEGLVIGRPVFSYPMAKGGFRVRYGRGRSNGLMAKSIHPSTMYILDEFIAVGTHIKIERPGKGAVLTPCDTIEPPIVKLKNGDVIKLDDVETAKSIYKDIEEILFLGDMLITFGDFSKSNNPLLPSGWCEEWYNEILKSKNIKPPKLDSVDAVFEFSKKHNIPLHPKYTYFWSDISVDEVNRLREYLKKVKKEGKVYFLPIEPEKRILELLCVPHKVSGNKIILSELDYSILTKTLNPNLIVDKKFDNVLEYLSFISGVKIMPFAPVYIGARMGRPEKAAERKMKPPVQGLFPTGDDNQRDFVRLYKYSKTGKLKNIYPELAFFKCPNCLKRTFYTKCPYCGTDTKLLRKCVVCGKYVETEIHCNKKTLSYERTPVNVVELLENIRMKLGPLPDSLKGVKGMMSELKLPERFEKLYYRAKHGVYVFKDGTCRFDATDTPLTHFKPKEINVSIDKLHSLGYDVDYKGNKLERDDQIVCLKPQDIILSKHGLEYFFKVANFIDDMLIGLYGEKPFYNLKKPEDLIGHLFLTMAPHTSNAILVRLIGYTEANVGFGHPYLHTAKRRNCDGDEDSVFLLLDAFLNFSKAFASSNRGATMDLPITLTVVVDPKEVDDEVYEMEVVNSYPLEFYEKTLEFAMPGEIKLKTVRDILGSPEQFGSLGLTHDTSRIDNGPLRTRYVKLKSVPEKIQHQFDLQSKILAVDIKETAEKLIQYHLIPDIYGNLRKFSRQSFRCTSCQSKYRRPPLKGKCLKCGGKLVLTVHKGGIEKYLDVALELVDRYGLDDYMRQRLLLVKDELGNIFNDEKQKQMGLSDFF